VLAPFAAGEELDATGCEPGVAIAEAGFVGAVAAFAIVGAMTDVSFGASIEALEDDFGFGAAGEGCCAEFNATFEVGLVGAGNETAAAVGAAADAGGGAGAEGTGCEAEVLGAAETSDELAVSVRVLEDVNIFCEADPRSFDLSSGSGGIADFGNALARTKPSSPLAVRTFTYPFTRSITST
jgi:hypothetical protein